MWWTLLACVPAPAPLVTPADPATPPRVEGVTALPALGEGARWWPLLAAGEPVAGVPFGGDAGGVADAMDANTLHVRDGRLWMVTHFERAAGALYVSELVRRSDGGFVAASTAPIPVDGPAVYNPCGAAPSPWGSHLGSEEYEPDAAVALADGHIPLEADRGRGVEREFDNGWNTRWRTLPGGSAPYRHGWAFEVKVGPQGAGALQRRFALGRYSHEQQLAVDDRTVYLSDDHPGGGGLYRFVAAAAGDLSRGTLAAAAFTAGPDAATLGTVRWVELGPTDDAVVAARWASPPSFTEILTRTLPADGVCAAGQLVESATGRECLGLVPGAEALARHFETRRYAGLRGATTAFPKEEGLAWDARRGRIFAAWSAVDADAARRLGVGTAPCGLVVSIDPVGGAVDVVASGELTSAGCATTGIANPDNLVWAPELDTLFIAEDGRKRGGENWLWALRDGRLTPVLRGPPTAEVSGLGWVVFGGEGWLAVDLQEESATTPSRLAMVGPLVLPAR